MSIVSFYWPSIKNEVVKLKRTFALWLSIISALFIPVIYFFYYLLKYESLIPKDGVNPWNSFISQQINNASPLLIPMFIVLVTSLVVQIEHKALGIKHLFTLPIPKWSVYFGKLIVVIGLVLFTYILFISLALLGGYIVGGIHKELQFWEFTPDLHRYIKLLFRSFTGVLGIVGLQFWLSFRIKNFIIPVGIGLILFITGLIVFRAEEAIYFPYAYSMLSLFSMRGEDITALVWLPSISIYSLGYFLIFSIIGFLDIRRMNIK